MAYTSEQILDAARAIRPLLGRLLGDEAVAFERELDLVIGRVAAGQAPAEDVLEYLSLHDATRKWALGFLETQAARNATLERPTRSLRIPPPPAPPPPAAPDPVGALPTAEPAYESALPPPPGEPAGESPADELTDAAPPEEPASESPVPAPGESVPKNGHGESQASEPVAANGGGSEDQRDPPRSAYGLLRCPEHVAVETEFELLVGLAREQEPGVAGGAIQRPESSVGPYSLDVNVDADGFELRPGESWRNELRVTYDAPYPTVSLHLTARAQPEQSRDTKIEASFAIDGQTRGLAVRYVTVHVSADTLAAPPRPTAGGVSMAFSGDEAAADLTIEIREWPEKSVGTLRWTLQSPHLDEMPDTAESNVRDDPKAFAVRLVQQMTIREGRAGMHEALLGVGRAVADQIPSVVLATLRAVAAKTAPRPPTCLILSQEPYVPWELAVIEPRLDDSAPPFLSTQAVVGRWIYDESPPPPPRPSAEVAMRDMAVVSGVYVKGWRRLEEAEHEANDLSAAYGALPVEATMDGVLACFRGEPAAEILHFAVHGKYDPTGLQDGIALVDGQMLDPFVVGGTNLRPSLVFLNACQVGVGNQMLGDYGGMAAAFLRVGASAVIAPLWSIDDKLARGFANSFYEATLTNGEPPAEVLMRQRRAIAEKGMTSGTPLAYQFFGHPLMRLARASQPTEGGTG